MPGLAAKCTAIAGRAAVRIDLTGQERVELASRLRRRKVGREDPPEAEIVLLVPDGITNKAIARPLGITRVTVALWRERFAAKRLSDEPRSGAPKKLAMTRLPRWRQRRWRICPSRRRTRSPARWLARPAWRR